MKLTTVLLALILFPGTALPALAAAGRDDAVREHIRALEASGMTDAASTLEAFEATRLAPQYLEQTRPAERLALFEEIREAAAASVSALVDRRDDVYTLTLSGSGFATEISFAVEPSAPYRMTALAVAGDAPGLRRLSLTESTLGEFFAKLAAEEGFSGIVYYEKGGEVVHRAAYGAANPATGAPIRLDTIFGVGSRPIDFTIAGIFLLAEQGKIGLDDPITKYLDNVPADKRSMTVRHLLNGQSGLPDFHDLPSDADPDLTWIDRDEAVRRIFAQELLFEPGTDRAHSHSAFGLAAAIIEIASGASYMAFLGEHFFTPAGMQRTGEYGDDLGLDDAEFAVGGGPDFVGTPNIPPNWGRTSWLVKGSGGMVSTLGDLLGFYDYVRGSGVLTGERREHFTRPNLHVDGSRRGFELFSLSANGGADRFFLLTNIEAGRPLFREILDAVEAMVSPEPRP